MRITIAVILSNILCLQFYDAQEASRTPYRPASTAIATHFGGTIKNVPGLNATADAVSLRQAMKGIGTNEVTVVNVMTARSNSDRQIIAKVYKDLYGKDLGYKFKWEFSFHALEMLKDLLVPPIDYDAQILYSSMKGAGTDLDSMTGVLCSKDSGQIKKIKEAYQRKYKKSLETAIKGDTSEPVWSLFQQLINSERENAIKPGEVEKDAKEIMATDLKHLKPNNALYRVLTTRSKDHIQQVLAEYQKLTNNPLRSILDQDLSGAITNQGKAIRTVKNLLECYNSPPKFYAKQINDAIKGGGTSDKKMFRTLIARSEIDLEDIKNEFKTLTSQDLPTRLKKESSGTYQRLLLGLLEGNRKIIP
ncbi:unnamed protein product [Gordionus sp. m RMFG-2023]|uniref:annexin A4-like n=1 Tax=Gordionus sp. m RMFG-2023 TaxID=3053472 RepID=UPI0030E1E1B5